MSPAVATSQSSSSSSKDVSKQGRRSESVSAQPRPRKSRVVRRRGRGRPGSIDSDDEIERESMTDVSDSDEPDSATESEAESEPESLALQNGRHHPDTPSTTQSPPPYEDVEGAAALNGSTSKAGSNATGALEPPRSAPAFLSAGVDWSEMVTAEGANGAAPLPVIDFSELHEHASDGPPHLSNQGDTGVPGKDDGDKDDAGTQKDVERPRRGGRGSSVGASRAAAQSARQAYQERLQSDPSFVPTVGEFWSHDDRLLQKDLRSLSGWWRGRWQGRGRGRGGFIGRGFRGRGRGAFFAGSRHLENDQADEVMQGEQSNPDHGDDLPPVERPWTHDGFEEMKAREEHRHAQKRFAKNKPAQYKGSDVASNAPSRGGFVPRDRGSVHGGASPTPSRSSYIKRRRAQLDRPWFAMKPEPVWTKQFEGFLYSDPSLKPKPGKPAGYRVKLPGKGVEIVQEPVPQKTREELTNLHSQPPSEMTVPTDASSRRIIVKLPSALQAKMPTSAEESAVQPEPLTTATDLLVEASVSYPTAEHSTVVQPGEADSYSPEQPAAASSPVVHESAPGTPALTRDQSSSEMSYAGIAAETAQLTMENDKQPPEVPPVPSGPMAPPPIQTSFPPPLQPTPSYSPVPYGYPSLPPGIAINQQGFAYEVASGRPVYLHPTPPPQVQIYTPRPMPYVPGHMHQHSLSGDYMPGPPTPPITSLVDPATGQPIFTLPRQSKRIEIRAPNDADEGRAKRERRPSNLRSVTVPEQNGDALRPQEQVLSGAVRPAFPEFVPASEYYQQGPMGGLPPQAPYQPSDGAASMSPGSEAQALASMDQTMIGYQPYQQQYYYPEQYYPAYIEMPQQPGQYDPYNTDPRQQPQVYY